MHACVKRVYLWVGGSVSRWMRASLCMCIWVGRSVGGWMRARVCACVCVRVGVRASVISNVCKIHIHLVAFIPKRINKTIPVNY